jgi:hypothetical protein
MSRLKKSKYNWQHVVTHWEEVVFRLCDELTPHDILKEVANYLESAVSECQALKFNPSKFSKALKHINKALTEIDPTDED